MSKHESMWKQVGEFRDATYPSLTKDLNIEVLVIGAGITGITCALELTAAGKKVAIIDAGRLGEGTTGYSTANLYIPVQPFYSRLRFKFGKNKINELIRSRDTAIQYIERTVKNNKIDCNFMRRPFYLFSRSPKKDKLIAKEVKILQKAGLRIKLISELPISVDFTKAALLENQARLNPLQYINALAVKLEEQGCQLFENTRMIKMTENETGVTVNTQDHQIVAEKVVLATHIPIGFNKTQFLSYPYRSYAVAFKLKSNEYVNGNFWEINTPFYAISTHNVFSKDLDMMIAAGYHHKTGHSCEKNNQAHFNTIKKHITSCFDVASIEYEWSAQHYQTADGIPYIGLASRSTKNVFIGTGYSTDGLVYGTVAGLLISDLILGVSNSWAKLYNPQRFTPLASSVRFMKENMYVFFDFIKGYTSYLFPKKRVNKGEGKIIKWQGKKYAAYRGENDELHLVSAICTHMGCIVKWNDAEKSWDCPCHGSRFSIDGKVIEGPALLPLKKHSFKGDWLNYN